MLEYLISLCRDMACFRVFQYFFSDSRYDIVVYARHNITYSNTHTHATPQHSTPHYTTLHYTRYTTLHYTRYTTLHYTTLHYTTLHYTALHYTALHYTTLHYTTLHPITHHTPPKRYLHCERPIPVISFPMTRQWCFQSKRKSSHSGDCATLLTN